MIGKLRKAIKRNILALSGKTSHLKNTISCEHHWYGNEYGGFYACPDQLSENSVIYSFGIGEDISFDRAIMEAFGCEIFAFDPTPKSRSFIEQQALSGKFHFFEFGLATQTGTATFYLPGNPKHVSGSALQHSNVSNTQSIQVEMKSFPDILHQLGHQQIDILKMDIEGSEYEVLDQILSSDISISQLLIEFHDRFFPDGLAKTKRAIDQLAKYGYRIFAVSDSLQEVSLIRRSSVQK